MIIPVDPNTTFGQATQMAVDVFQDLQPGDYRYAGVFFAFHSDYDEAGMASRWGRISTTVTLIDEQGHAVWNQPAYSARIQELLAAEKRMLSSAIHGGPTSSSIHRWATAS